MSQSSLEDQPSQIHIKRPFNVKTIRDLDRYQHDLNKIKRKQFKNTTHKHKQANSNNHIGSATDDKIISKLPQVIRNGNRIIAEWKNDEIHGLAQIFYQNGIYFKGQYLNGIKVKGHFKFKSGFQYIGSCFGNKFAGQGLLIFPNGKTIEGDWKNFEVVGNGKISYAKGEVYYGEIKNFKKHGKGYFYFTDGSKYQGQFVEGLISGKGSYFIEDKLVSAGKWFNGELQEEDISDKQNMPFKQTMDKTLPRKGDNISSLECVLEKTVMGSSRSQSKKVCEEVKEAKKVHFN